MSVMYESAHDSITFVITWNEFYHNTQPETISNICTRYIFQTVFRENIGDFTELRNEKINLEVTCKRERFGYWNSSVFPQKF